MAARPCFSFFRIQINFFKKLKSVGSDHFPILIKLIFIPAEKNRHDEPQADSEDKAEENEKIAEARSI